MIRFSGTPSDCSLVPSLLSRPLDFRLKARRRAGGKVESVLCFPSAASFPRPSSCRALQMLMAIVFAAGQHGPGDARQFVGDGDNHFVAWSSLTQPVNPLSQSRSVVLDAPHHSAGSVDQHAPQIDIAAFTDAEQSLLSASGVLPRHDAKPSRQIARPRRTSLALRAASLLFRPV